MENGPPIGLEDGTIDVERLLVEPQDGHVSMDSVLCFNEKIPVTDMGMEDVSRSFGASHTDVTQEGEDFLNGEVLDAIPSEVEVGYLRLHNDFCSIGEDYLLGVQFAESITNLDYGSSEGLQTSVPESQMQVASTISDAACRSNLFKMAEVPDCENDRLNVRSSELNDIPSYHESERLIRKKPSVSSRSCTSQNIDKFHKSSSSSFEDDLSDENGGRNSPLDEIICGPKTENKKEFELTGQEGQANILERQEVLATSSVQANCIDDLPTRKRSRKPTQRYIDELADPISTYSKKRREVSSSTLKVKKKPLGVEDHKKCHMGSGAIRLPAEDSSVIAIQVPFGSLVQKESPKGHLYNTHVDSGNVGADSGNVITKSKVKRATPENQKKRDECITTVYLKKRDDYPTSQEEGDDCVAAIQLKKRDDRKISTNQKKRNDCTISVATKKKDKCVTDVSQNRRDDCHRAVHHKKREKSLSAESPEEVSVRRKHHRLWTTAEVRKLIDGVSQYGVGRWSRIKKLFFSTSAHRTSVDLKDKWRNLLKASGIQEQGTQEGEKKRNVAWRPLPKSILRRVCELAAMHPYPKGQRANKIVHSSDLNTNDVNTSDDSPDRSTGTTLNDYRRILRSIGN